MVIFPYAFVTALHIGLNILWDKEQYFNPLVAEYTLWFMTGIIVWRLIAPLLFRFRHPLAIAVLISLVAGSLRGLWVFNLHTVLGYLPFFVLGVLLRRDNRWLRRRSVKKTVLATSIVAMWLIGVAVAFNLSMIRRATIGMIGDYPDGNLAGMGGRLLLLCVGAVTVLSMLYLIPRRHLKLITYIGSGGFTIYLFHGLVLRWLRNAELMPAPADEQWWTVPSLVLFSFALAALLGSKPFRWLARPIVRPRLKWLLRPDRDEFAPRRRTRAGADRDSDGPDAQSSTRSTS